MVRKHGVIAVLGFSTAFIASTPSFAARAIQGTVGEVSAADGAALGPVGFRIWSALESGELNFNDNTAACRNIRCIRPYLSDTFLEPGGYFGNQEATQVYNGDLPDQPFYELVDASMNDTTSNHIGYFAVSGVTANNSGVGDFYSSGCAGTLRATNCLGRLDNTFAAPPLQNTSVTYGVTSNTIHAIGGLNPIPNVRVQVGNGCPAGMACLSWNDPPTYASAMHPSTTGLAPQSPVLGVNLYKHFSSSCVPPRGDSDWTFVGRFDLGQNSRQEPPPSSGCDYYALKVRLIGPGYLPNEMETYRVGVNSWGVGSACGTSGPCDDLNSCTTNDVCNDGRCAGSAGQSGIACSDSDSCTVNESCNNGVCDGGTCFCNESGPGLLAWWPGDGNAMDISGSGNDGTLMNGAAFGSGKVGQAFSFDGIDDHVRVDQPLFAALDPGPGSFSVAAWIRTSTAAGGAFVLSKYECGGVCLADANSLYHVTVGSDGTPHFALRDADASSSIQGIGGPTSVADGNWHLLVGRRHMVGQTMDLYVDGALAASSALTSNSDGSITDEDGEPDPFIIGAEMVPGSSSTTSSFSGLIDEVMYFNRALSAEEIRAIYDAGSQGVCKTCTDADGDGYGLAGDTCHNGTVLDCDRGDASVWQVPGEAMGLLAARTAPAGSVVLTWSPPATGGTPAGMRYDVVRGSIAALPVGPGGIDEFCFDNLSSAASITDTTIPAVGSGYWYLSRGENTCGNGTLGFQGVHGVPGAARSTTTCP